MNIQVLVATMNQMDHSLLEKMNINSDVIVGNQCNKNLIEKFKYKTYNAMYLNFNERGVGLNRNNALMRATGDICLFADDDMVYEDEYVNIVKKAFLDNPKADVIIFNLCGRTFEKKVHRVNYFNYMRYGTARIAIKLASVKKKGIYFNQCFGGGTEHCHGEDTLFLTSCLKAKLRVYAVPITIAMLTEERKSTWADVDIEKYLKDQGVLYKTISNKYWRLLCLQDAIRHHKIYKIPIFQSYKIMKRIK